MDIVGLIKQFGPFGVLILVPIVLLIFVLIYEKVMNVKIEKERLNRDIGRKQAKEEKDEKNGYAVLDVPQEFKSLIHEYLLGFEEFAKAKGHNISISVDNSLKDKMAVKFVINNQNGFFTSEEVIKEDFFEYFENLNSDEAFTKTKDKVKENGSESQKESFDIFEIKRDFLRKAENKKNKNVVYYAKNLIKIDIVAEKLSLGDVGMTEKRNSDNSLIGSSVGDGSTVHNNDILINSTKTSGIAPESLTLLLDKFDGLISSGLLNSDHSKSVTKAKVNVELSKEELEKPTPDNSIVKKYIGNAVGSMKSIKDIASYGKSTIDSIQAITDAVGNLI